MKGMRYNNTAVSFLFVSLIYFVFLGLCKPIMNSDDDFYALYTLAGGYGGEPSNILHYSYGWNPIIFWPVSRLFSLFPHFNWYTLFLLGLQWISSVYLLHMFLRLFRALIACSIFLGFFLFFGSQFLHALNYSNTSFMLSICGSTGLLLNFSNQFKNASSDAKRLAVPLLLLLVGGLLRVHALGLTVLSCVEIGFFVLPFRQLKKMALSLAMLCSIIAGCTLAHNLYFEKTIPGIREEEKFRQAVFYITNRPQTLETRDTGMAEVRNSFIQTYFFYDTSFVTDRDLEKYSRENIRNRVGRQSEISYMLHWLFINARIYLVLLGLILFMLVLSKDLKSILQWLAIFFCSILTLTALLLFFKITPGIGMTTVSLVFLSGVFCLNRNRLQGRVLRLSIFLPFLAISLWMLARIKKNNDQFLKQIQSTRGLLNELKAHKDTLFVFTNKFDDNGFYIWDTPGKYPANNLVNFELVLTRSYYPILRRFRITDLMLDLPYRQDILIAGPNLPLLREYYMSEKGLNVWITKAGGFKYLTAYEVRTASN